MPATTERCLECGNDPRQIKTGTVRNMVKPSGNRDIDDAVQFHICKITDCPVVYIADELDQQFEIGVIRERPNFKLDADADPNPLCYCFGFDKEHVQKDIAENEETDIDDWITGRVQAEECARRLKSPLGSGCLGNVRGAIQEAKRELA